MTLTSGRKYAHRPSGSTCSRLAQGWFVRQGGHLVEECVVFCPDDDPEMVMVMTEDDFLNDFEDLSRGHQ